MKAPPKTPTPEPVEATAPEAAEAQRRGPTLTGWDPMTRLPNEPLVAYATFRRWHRDHRDDPAPRAAAALGITESVLADLTRAFYWQERAIALASGSALELTPRPWATDARILSPLPEDAAELVRRREWATAAELVATAVDAIRDWRASDKPPTLSDLVKLLDSATRLARLAAGMPQEGPAIAAAINDNVVSGLTEAIDKIYAEVSPQLGRARSPNGPSTHENIGSSDGRFGETSLPGLPAAPEAKALQFPGLRSRPQPEFLTASGRHRSGERRPLPGFLERTLRPATYERTPGYS